jgi:hypothetical protein
MMITRKCIGKDCPKTWGMTVPHNVNMRLTVSGSVQNICFIGGIVYMACGCASMPAGDRHPADEDTATTAKTSYYGGEVRLISLSSGQASNQKILMARTLNPTSNIIVEVACIQSPGQPAQVSPTYISVTGASAALSDSPPPAASKTFTGTGMLHGRPWAWDYLTYTIHFPLPAGQLRIQDDNLITPTQFVARKQLFYTSTSEPAQAEVPIQLWDTEMNSLDISAYQSTYNAMGCK